MAAEEELIQPQQEKMARQAENAELRAKLAGVSETLTQGRQQLEALEEQQAKDSHNSHLPPSSRKQDMFSADRLGTDFGRSSRFPCFLALLNSYGATIFNRYKNANFLPLLCIIALLSVAGASPFLRTKSPLTPPIGSTPIPSTSLPGDYTQQMKPFYPSTSTQTPATVQPTSLPSRAPSVPPPATPRTSASRIYPSGQAMPIGDIPGWHQVFADDFNGPTLNTSHWYPYSGQPGGDPAGWWDPPHVIVSGGLLTLKGYKDASGVFVTGGIGMNSSYARTYGKYLVRMRVDKGDGISAIALLWPQAHVWPPEVDFFEDGGGHRRGMSATLHCGPNGNDNCRVQKELSGYDFSQWHTLGVEWTAGKLVYTIDGTTWATVTGSRVPSIPMVLDLQTQSLACSQYNTCLDSSTPTEVDMQVDWVVAYAPA